MDLDLRLSLPFAFLVSTEVIAGNTDPSPAFRKMTLRFSVSHSETECGSASASVSRY